MSNPLSGQERGFRLFSLFSERWERPGFAGMPLQIDHVLGLSI